MQRHRATNNTHSPRAGVRHPLAWGIACGLAVAFAALAFAGMGRASADTSDYTVVCENPGVTGTFSFSPSPSTDPFTVRLTYHIPGNATFIAVPGASTDFPAGTTSPVSFSFSTANVPPEANTIRIDNTLNTSKSVSFTCPGVTAPTETPPPAPTSTDTPGPSSTSVPPTSTSVAPTATPPPGSTATPTSVPGANTPTNTPPAGGGGSTVVPPSTPTRISTALAAQATSAAQRPAGTLALPNTGASDNAGSAGELMLSAGLIALIALFTTGTGIVLRRRSTSDRT